MLIEFSVENYKSYATKQTLSMVAGSDNSHPDNLIISDRLSSMKLLRSVVIYGANASGKSNLFEALEFMSTYVTDSVKEKLEGTSSGRIRFGLNPEWKEKPTQFEISFIVAGVRYEYGFALVQRHITEEWLYAYPNNRPQLWFMRSYDEAKDDFDWEFGANLKGEKRRLIDFVRPDLLYLSIATQFNHKQLTEVYNWFKDVLSFVDDRPIHWKRKLLNECSVDIHERTRDMLRFADVGIRDFRVEERSDDMYEIKTNVPEDDPQFIEMVENFKYEIVTSHLAADGTTVDFPIWFESEGTKRLLALSIEWLRALNDGRTLIVDEIDKSMHPLLVRELVKMFHSPEVNKANAQLIFNTHDTTVLDQQLLRRDQIWFVEKSEEGASELYSLWEFSPRREADIEKPYLRGRYGAIPFISEFTWDCE